jgi:thiol-disulfide isomerase/thioredoxin
MVVIPKHGNARRGAGTPREAGLTANDRASSTPRLWQRLEGAEDERIDVNGSQPAGRSRAHALSRIADAIALGLIALAVWRFLIEPHVPAGRFSAVQAPSVRLPLMGGGTFDLAEARGHVVFLDFWASWCGPCKQSIPLIEHYKATHPDALVVSVDAGEPVRTAEAYARRAKMRRVAFDPDMKVTDAFGVQVFPTMVVIGRDGKERAKWVGFNPLIQQDMARAAARY